VTDDPDDFEKRLGYRFEDPALLAAALTHRSFSYEAGDAVTANYERLEFLGDALIGFLVADWLVAGDAAADEGELTRRRQALIRMESLADAARRLGVGEKLRLGRGEDVTGGRTKPSILADTFEALTAAIYRDGGLRAARAFVARHLRAELRATHRGGLPVSDWKSRLQELCQSRSRQTPHYRIVSTTGPAHALTFEAEALLAGKLLATGRGASRKQAEQAAALAALSELELGR
jgi:ribonuclease-3